MKGGKRLLLYFGNGKKEIGQSPANQGRDIAQAIIVITNPEDPGAIMTQAFLAKLQSISTDVLNLEIPSVHCVQSTLILLRAPIGWALRLCWTAPPGLVSLLGITDMNLLKLEAMITTDRDADEHSSDIADHSSSPIEYGELWAQGSVALSEEYS